LATQLRELHIHDMRYVDPDQSHFQLSVPEVAALGSLSVLTSLKLQYLQCPDVQLQQHYSAAQHYSSCS
jgi:hypothetical protein